MISPVTLSKRDVDMKKCTVGKQLGIGSYRPIREDLSSGLYECVLEYLAVTDAFMAKNPSHRVPYAMYVGASAGNSRGLPFFENGGSAELAGAFREPINFQETFPQPLNSTLEHLASSIKAGRYHEAQLVESFLYWVKDESQNYLLLDDAGRSLPAVTIEKQGSPIIVSGIERQQQKQDNRELLTWEDVAGYEDIVQQFRDIQMMMKNAAQTIEEGCLPHDKILPKGTLLYGPPGTGKSLLVQTLCDQAGVPVQYINVEHIGSKYQFEAPKEFQKRFNIAASHINGDNLFSIMAMDECKGMLAKRSDLRGQDAQNLVNCFLKNTDTNQLARAGVVLFLMDNDREGLDEAVLRSGRVGNHVYVGYPTRSDISRIAAHYFDKYDIQGGLSPEKLASEVRRTDDTRETPGPVGADIEEAAIKAVRKRLLHRYKSGVRFENPSGDDVLCELKRICSS
ncbi:AAA family ATPase [Candidatus Woesearchaeota archaeon]|nr:AAA family ATPase [Candidatus Woesearchaeota archaeon]